MKQTLDQQVEGAAVIVTFVLVLLPLFTSTRESTLNALRSDANATPGDARLQEALLIGLMTITVVAFIAGLPLWLEVVGHLSATSASGVVRSLFALAWLLLLGLIAWQISLICRACSLKKKLKAAQ